MSWFLLILHLTSGGDIQNIGSATGTTNVIGILSSQTETISFSAPAIDLTDRILVVEYWLDVTTGPTLVAADVTFKTNSSSETAVVPTSPSTNYYLGMAQLHSIGLDESISTSESTSKNVIPLISENLFAIEFISIQVSFPELELISITDGISITITKPLSEAATVSDIAARDYLSTRSVSDLLAAQDIVGAGNMLQLAASDVLGFQDQIAAVKTAQQPLPNVIMFVSDDQPSYTLKYMPNVKSEIFGKGTKFTDGWLSTSLCCPSRSSIMTGLYAHNHGVTNNTAQLDEQTVFQSIRSAGLGYRTAMIGKYLNSHDGSCRPEFSYWVAFGSELFKPDRRSWYTDGMLNVNCTWKSYTNKYSTYLLRDKAMGFINNAIDDKKPFAMLFAAKNPHRPATPAPEDENLYPNGLPSYYMPPSFNEADVSDKPSWVQQLPLLSVDQIQEMKSDQTRWARNLVGLDRSIGDILDLLETKGQLSNTLIFYISDNGFFHGEHRITNGKNEHYKESTKALMGMRWDGHVPVGNDDSLVGNIDIAPTIYDALNLIPPYLMDGQSLLEPVTRTSFLTEHWRADRMDATVITKNWTYTETKVDKFELYDRINDPYELDNLWCSAPCAYSDTITQLAVELRLLRPGWT
jgi:arylsulfatase A-like enzyme